MTEYTQSEIKQAINGIRFVEWTLLFLQGFFTGWFMEHDNSTYPWQLLMWACGNAILVVAYGFFNFVRGRMSADAD